MQAAQMQSIAFENIEVLLGRLPALDSASIWQKLVGERRGGYCLELNALYSEALTALGFRVRPLLGRVRMGAETGGPRTHLALIVRLDGVEWLTDCGFGGPGPLTPLRLDITEPQICKAGSYRLRHDQITGETVLQRRERDNWFPLYGFDRSWVSPADFEAANVICTRSPSSPFHRNLMMSIATKTGRISLFNARRTEIDGDRETVRQLASLDELAWSLSEDFGLDVDRLRIKLVWAHLENGQTASPVQRRALLGNEPA
ncbi:N-hydroxyarylamine O-acetyltransferase [Hartmannibacter diazotrophicus]|uniref:N-hydroxyarylamine O-acetyltransferase n=2 Tax=Hartmannibacter diazotrophicus TaxID=1482074 RepID=A0A2C9D9K8_9HYPH|nr:N-hydroxyarylamine O-acetyltransferase [Hartmannibacter diazotrophicus]